MEEARLTLLIVDSSAFGRAALQRFLEADPQLAVVGAFRSSEEAWAAVLELSPDVVVISFNGAHQDPLVLVKRVMEESPRPVIVVASSNLPSKTHLQVLELGAVALVAWDADLSTARLLAFQSLLASKVKAYGAAVTLRTIDLPMPSAPQLNRRAEVAVVGTGPGSIQQFRRVISRLPGSLNLAIIGLTHLPPELLPLFGEKLGRETALKVSLPREGDPVRPGTVLLAPANSNVCLVKTGRIPRALVSMRAPSPGLVSVPSLDVTLEACAWIYGDQVTAVVLGGLGRDGVDGFQAIRKAGGVTLVADPRHSVAPTLNLACLDTGCTDFVLDEIGMIEALSELGRSERSE